MSKLRAAAGVAAAQLRHDRARTILAVVGIAVAVLSTTLLASVGAGVVETGQQKFDASGRDLWVTGGSFEGAGGYGTALLNSHEVASDIQSRPDVDRAVPMAFNGVYVANNTSEPQTVVGVGVPFGGPYVQLDAGPGFEKTEDVHYANGSYDGPMTNAVIIDSRTAETFDVGVGDQLHIGGSVESARENTFRVVGISPTFSRFLGAATVTLHLSELQEVTGTTGTDRATFVTVSLKDGANASAVEADLESQYPDYTIRTNTEQMQSVLQNNAVVIAVGAALVVMSIIAGFALTVNILSIVVFQQREELAALSALGVSDGTLVAVVAGQGILLGAFGAVVGLAATPPSVVALNFVAAEVVGFEGLVQMQGRVLLLGAVIALVIGTLSAVVAGWRTLKTAGVESLPR